MIETSKLDETYPIAKTMSSHRNMMTSNNISASGFGTLMIDFRNLCSNEINTDLILPTYYDDNNHCVEKNKSKYAKFLDRFLDCIVSRRSTSFPQTDLCREERRRNGSDPNESGEDA